MTFRFIHSSDLHLGRRFAKITSLAEAARSHGRQHVLLAGDTFDTSTPSQQVLRQALAAMRDAGDVQWWLLPGNHDNMRNAEPVWDIIAGSALNNVHPVLTTDVVELEPAVALLPCPVTVRSTGRDLTEILPRMETPDGTLRIGLAHGGVVDFTESGEAIPPDRDKIAGLDYLALGDWHGRLQVSARTQYSGSPEQDRFKHGRRGVCLSVAIEDRGAEPKVQEIETGTFLWSEAALQLHEGEDTALAIERLLPDTERRNTLVRVTATGWSSLAGQAALGEAAEKHAPEFALFELLTDGLRTIYDVTDLDEIDHAGAMRLAAESLMKEAGDEALAEEDREIAAAALSRLYVYARESAQ